MKQNYSTTDADAGRRIDVVLAGRLGNTRSFWQKQLKMGRVTIGGSKVKAKTSVTTGQQIVVDSPKSEMEIPELPVLYEDNHVMVVDKPAGLLVHPTGTSTEGTASQFAALHTSDTDPDRPGIVHRLDRETSGLLVIAKDSETKDYLQRLFKTRDVKKTYLALVEGHLKDQDALIDLPIGRSLKNPSKRAVTPLGRKALTRYKVLTEWPGYSLVEVKPETGRTHQIRVHFSHLGHPVMGDNVYGHSKGKLGLNRHFLHAVKLELVGPDGKTINVESPIPVDLAQVLAELDKRYNP